MGKLFVTLCALLALTFTTFGLASCMGGNKESGNKTSESSSGTTESTSTPDDSSEPGSESNSEITVNIYTITWKDGDEVLSTTTVEEGDTPVYEGTPTKEADEGYAYTFIGWTPAIVAATEDATYTAGFDLAAVTYTAKIIRATGAEETVEFTVENRADKLAAIELTEDTEINAYEWSITLPEELALNNDQVFTEVKKTAYTVNHYLAYDDESVSSDLSGYRYYKAQKLFGIEGEDTEAAALTLTGFAAGEIDQVEIASDGSAEVDIFYARDMLVETFEQYAEYYDGADFAAISAPTDDPHVVTADSAIAPHMTEGYVDESPYEGENSLRYTWNNGNIFIRIIYYFNEAQLNAIKKGGSVTFAIKMTGNASGGATFLINGARDWETSDPNAFHKYDINEDGIDIWQNHLARSWSVITVGEGSMEGMIEDECLIIESAYVEGQGTGAGFCLYLDNVTVIPAENYYTVNYYLPKSIASTHDDLTGYELAWSQCFAGTAEETASVKARAYTGFVAEALDPVTVAADNSTVINVFYKFDPLAQTFEGIPTPSGEEDPWSWVGNTLSYNGTALVGQNGAAEVPVITDENTAAVTIGGNTVVNNAANGTKCARFYNANGMFGAIVIYLNEEQKTALNAGGSLTFAMKVVTNASVGLTMMVNNSHGWTTVENTGNSYKYDFNEDNLDFWARPTTTQWQTVVVDAAGIEFAKTYGYICIDTNGVGNAPATGKEYYMWIDDVVVTPAN